MSGDYVVYVTTAQAATWVGTTERTIRRWITAGLLPTARNPAGTPMVRLADVNAADRRQRLRLDARDRRRRKQLRDLTSVSDTPRIVDEESPSAD